MDPGNEKTSYESNIHVTELIKIEDVMEEFKLGPNGSLIYAMNFLIENFDWLEQKLKNY